MKTLDFNKTLEYIDYFYWENDNKNRLFNVAKQSISILFDKYYDRTKDQKDFNTIDWQEREKIFHEALEDFVNDLSKDI